MFFFIFTFNYWNTAAQDSYVNDRVTQILSGIVTPDMSDFEKQKKDSRLDRTKCGL